MLSIRNDTIGNDKIKRKPIMDLRQISTKKSFN